MEIILGVPLAILFLIFGPFAWIMGVTAVLQRIFFAIGKGVRTRHFIRSGMELIVTSEISLSEEMLFLKDGWKEIPWN